MFWKNKKLFVNFLKYFKNCEKILETFWSDFVEVERDILMKFRRKFWKNLRKKFESIPEKLTRNYEELSK